MKQYNRNELNLKQILEILIEKITKQSISIYQNYNELLFWFASIFLGLIFYRLGKSSYNTKSLQYLIVKLNKVYQSKQKIKLSELSGKKTIKFFKLLYRIGFVILFIFQFVLYQKQIQKQLNLQRKKILPLKSWSKYLQINQTYFKIILHIASLVLLIIWWKAITFYQRYLFQANKSRLNLLVKMEISGLDEFVKNLGAKAVSKIKNKICQQFLLKIYYEQKQNAQKCKNQSCKTQIKLLTKNYDTHRKFISKAFDFKWCDICLNKRKMDLDLSTNNTKKQFENEKQEVEYQLSELQSRCSKIKMFFDVMCKSSCGLRYWKLSKQIGSIFKVEKTSILQSLNTFYKK